MWNMNCGTCGKASPADQWLESATGIKHPLDLRQCPKCKTAIKLTRRPSTVFVADNGKELMIPGNIKIEVGVHI